MLMGMVWVLTWALVACESGGGGEALVEADYSNCRYEKPEAIFYDGLPQISDHRFERRGRGSEEKFTLSGGIAVTILQYGCDDRTQEFIFELNQRNLCESTEDCTRHIAQLLHALSRLGPEFHVFRAWSQAIREVAPSLSFGESAELAEGFWVKVDQKSGFGNTTLMLTLSEKP